MKKFTAFFPAHFDWSTALKDGLVFGITAAIAIHLLPALSRAVITAIGLAGASFGADEAASSPFLKLFGQRR